MVVGDSYTFGDTVSDHESWPAILQESLGYRYQVLNFGVGGYGLDQSVLLAEKVLPKYRAKHLIVSFIPDDIRRSEWATYKVKHGQLKPYFIVREDSLVLKNVPVPREQSGLLRFGYVRTVLGYSHLGDALMRRLAPSIWFPEDHDDPSESQESGVRVGCLLMKRLSHLAFDKEIRVMVLAQYQFEESDEAMGWAREVLKCANRQRVQVVDLFEGLNHIRNVARSEYNSMYQLGHMSAKGNSWVAERLRRDFLVQEREIAEARTY
jgi:hypothetical protein